MSGGSQNTVSQQTLPAWAQPYFTAALGQGQQLLNSGGPQYYPGQQVANLTPMQQAGFTTIGNTALGNNASQGAQAANQFMTSGALLNPNANPYLQGQFNLGAGNVQNQLASEFGTAGSNVINSVPVQQQGLTDLASNLYGGAYGQGLQAMTQAETAAPIIDQGTYLPGQELLQAGSGQQQQAQNQINALMQQYNWNSQLPENMLSWYSGLLGQNASPFGGANSTANMSGNSASTALGAGVGALGLMAEILPLFMA